MAIKWASDLGAPAAVAVVNIGLKAMKKPEWTKWANGIMTVGGYAGAFLGFGGDFLKNIGIAALPSTANDIYDYFVPATVTSKASRQVTFQRTALVASQPMNAISQTPGPGFQNLQRTY